MANLVIVPPNSLTLALSVGQGPSGPRGERGELGVPYYIFPDTTYTIAQFYQAYAPVAIVNDGLIINDGILVIG